MAGDPSATDSPPTAPDRSEKSEPVSADGLVCADVSVGLGVVGLGVVGLGVVGLGVVGLGAAGVGGVTGGVGDLGG